MKLSIAAAIALLTMSTTVNARLHPNDDSKKNRKLQWGPSKNMVERSLASPAITAIRGDIDLLKAANVTAVTAIATANAEITELRSDVVLLEAEDVTLNDQIATANTAIDTANTKITELQDDVISLEAANVTLHVQIATADNAIDTANAKITELRGDVDRLEAANVTLHDQIATADAAIDTANAEITVLRSDVDRLEAANVTVNARLEAAEATISAAVATIRALTARVQVLEVMNERIVFVTSEVYTGGQIGGIAGAHSKCQTLADAEGLSGIFKAWLSDSNGNSPAQDFVKSDFPYVMTNGDKVADNWQDLITNDGSGYLDNPIRFDEDGVSATFSVWTGTDATGMPNPGTGGFCDDWKSDTGGNAIVGRSSYTNQWWTSNGVFSCAGAARLYCFEQ